jgi:hypothetical protein
MALMECSAEQKTLLKDKNGLQSFSTEQMCPVTGNGI